MPWGMITTPSSSARTRLRSAFQFLSPDGRQSRHAEQPSQRVWGGILIEHETEHLGHGDPRPVLGDTFDRVAGPDHALLQHGEIDPRLSGLEEGFDHAGIVEPKPELVARHPRLRDDQPGRPDAELVADVNRILEQPLVVRFSPKIPGVNSRPSCSLQGPKCSLG